MTSKQTVAFDCGEYRDFTGYVNFHGTEGYARDASFDLCVAWDGSPVISWHNGVWQGGTMSVVWWEGGVFENGLFLKSTWAGGAWLDGTFRNSSWMTGRFENGLFESSSWDEGVFAGGVFKNSTWYRGEWAGGRWEQSSYMGEDGRIHGVNHTRWKRHCMEVSSVPN